MTFVRKTRAFYIDEIDGWTTRLLTNTDVKLKVQSQQTILLKNFNITVLFKMVRDSNYKNQIIFLQDGLANF
jgi:hypothetical protein